MLREALKFLFRGHIIFDQDDIQLEGDIYKMPGSVHYGPEYEISAISNGRKWQYQVTYPDGSSQYTKPNSGTSPHDIPEFTKGDYDE